MNKVDQRLVERIKNRAVSWFPCACGAFSFTMDDDSGLSVASHNLGALGIDTREIAREDRGQIEQYGNCNHCVNHWGIDQCACGCGADIVQGEKCEHEES